MRLRIGYELDFDFPQPTPVLSVLNVHYSRASDLEAPDLIRLDPPVPVQGYRDGFGNWCGRFTAPAGPIRISTDTVIRDSGLPDPYVPDARQHPIEELPDEALVFLLASRFCESDRMLDLAWQLFGATQPGWARVQAVCDFAHNHIRFDYNQARPTRSAFEAYDEGVGVCRDYAHLAVSFCRALNIPARYCTGYLGDVGTPPPYAAGRLRRLVRGLPRRRLAPLRPAQQRAPPEPRAHGLRPRRRRRGAHHHLRPRRHAELPRLDRRDPGSLTPVPDASGTSSPRRSSAITRNETTAQRGPRPKTPPGRERGQRHARGGPPKRPPEGAGGRCPGSGPGRDGSTRPTQPHPPAKTATARLLEQPLRRWP